MSAASFTVTVPAPTITGFSPTSGPAGTSVTLTGTRFTGATSVRFSGTSAAFSVAHDSHISTSVHPVLMLRDARTGEMRGFLRGGSAILDDAPDEFEVQFRTVSAAA
jgi:hypothetical protein